MLRKILVLCICLIMIFSLVSSAKAADIPLVPTDDSYTFSNEPNATHNGLNLFAGYSNSGGCIQNYRVFLQFDISSYTTDVNPSDTVVRLYALMVGVANESVSIYSVGDGWDETTLTWNNQPTVIDLLDTRAANEGAVLFSSTALGNYINSQRGAHSGDNIVSFMVIYNACLSPESNIVAFEDKENSFGSGELPLLWPGYPTTVTVSEFSASPVYQNIRVQWQTSSEVDLLGFNVYRSSEPDGVKEKLNSSLIPATGLGNPLGASYEFVDSTALAGQTYYYWLEMEFITWNEMYEHNAQATANHVTYIPAVRSSSTALANDSASLPKRLHGR